jgi:hypothetical protein
LLAQRVDAQRFERRLIVRGCDTCEQLRLKRCEISGLAVHPGSLADRLASKQFANARRFCSLADHFDTVLPLGKGEFPMRAVRNVIAAVVAMAAGPALAQAPEEAAPVEQAAPLVAEAPASIRIPAGTVVQVELTEALSSETSEQEQLFGLRLAEPIVIDGRDLVPAGAEGGGEVIDAAPSAFGGRQGRLIISGRYIEIGGQRVRIRGMQITAAGDHRVNTALAVSMIPYAGIAGIFVQGGEVEIPVGARGTARLAADVDIPIAAPAAAEEAAAPPPEELVQASHGGENQ